jgi:hypothetical protein
MDRARSAAAGRRLVQRGAGPVSVATGAQLNVVLDVPDFGISGDVSTLLWVGDIANCTFEIRVPERIVAGYHVGRANVYLGILKIVSLRFELEVSSRSEQLLDVTDTASWIRSAFASYATQDRPKVLSRIQGMLKLLPQLDIFLDVVTLRAGDRWEERVREEIASRDVFYLFWSMAASISHWVAGEWRLALTTRGLDYISPVPLVSPAAVPPPPELAALHFNDWTLALT